jgi:hypothetical protein
MSYGDVAVLIGQKLATTVNLTLVYAITAWLPVLNNLRIGIHKVEHLGGSGGRRPIFLGMLMWLPIVVDKTIRAGIVVNHNLTLCNAMLRIYNANAPQPIVAPINPHVLNALTETRMLTSLRYYQL